MGIFDFLFGKKKDTEEQQIVYEILTMNGVNRQIPGPTYFALQDAFLQKSQKILNTDSAFSKLKSDHFAQAKQESHTILEISGINIVEDPIKWLSQEVGVSRQKLKGQLGTRLFMNKGSTSYQTYGQTRQAEYSVTYYFSGKLEEPKVEARIADATVQASGGAQNEKANEEAGYTVEQAYADLSKAFGGGAVDVAAIKQIGQKIYDAKVPLKNGVGGMHQVFHMVKARFPQLAGQLSKIWDGVGDWAD